MFSLDIVADDREIDIAERSGKPRIRTDRADVGVKVELFNKPCVRATIAAGVRRLEWPLETELRPPNRPPC